MKLIDTHTHLYLSDFDSDLEMVMQRSFDEGLKKFYMPSIDSSETERILTLEKKYPDNCFAMMGLHPCSVKENYKEELSIILKWLNERSFAAIGETGLDFYWDKTFTEQQYESLHQQIEWALQFNLPVVLHTRNAMDEAINVVKQYVPNGLRGIFHCFTGNYQNAVDIIEAGFLLGIGGVVTYKNSGLAEIIEQVDLSNIVLETDAPYLTPVPFRGKRNESSYIKYVAQKIADIKKISVQEVALTTTTNAEKIFNSHSL